MTQVRVIFSEHELERARDRFYPDWWLHRTQARTVTDMPSYSIVCHSVEEHILAMACKPHYVLVHVTLMREATYVDCEEVALADASYLEYPSLHERSEQS